jgi:ABC-type sugar transport system permease subunit
LGKTPLTSATQIFLVVSTILWIISGIIIHQMWGYVECENEGVANDFGQFKSQIMGGLSECHEIKIIEIIAWAIAGVSILATIPVVMTAMKRRKMEHERKTRSGANYAA